MDVAGERHMPRNTIYRDDDEDDWTEDGRKFFEWRHTIRTTQLEKRNLVKDTGQAEEQDERQYCPRIRREDECQQS